MTAVSCRDLLLNMPEMGRASDEEIAYLPETELINAAKQFRWIVETAISSADAGISADAYEDTATSAGSHASEDTATSEDPVCLGAAGRSFTR